MGLLELAQYLIVPVCILCVALVIGVALNRFLMEKISRRILAPAQRGVQYQTRWFYERARGQYVQEQLKLSAREKNS